MNRGGEIDFASEDLGLAPVVGDLEGDDFDAFNDDTFGAEDVWVEDDHEELAKFTEEERQAMQETDGFFDFDNAGHHSPLEPEPHGDGHAQNGRQDLESPRHHHHHHHHHELSDLAREVDDKMRFGSPAHVHHHEHHQLPPADPAIVNVMRFPPVPMMPPFLPPGAPPPFPPGITQQVPNFPGPMPHGLHDPAIMSMGQIPPHLLLLQQQQLQRQLNPMMNQPPPPQQNKPGGIRTVEEIERQLLSDQHQNELRQQQQQQQARFHHHQQQQQHQFQQQQQQARFQQHQQQQRHNHHGQNYGNTGRHQNQFNQPQQQSRYRNNFDDKNRETFGDDFVEHHAVQQRQQQQHGNHLITPGHVHVLGILRGARERTRGPGPSMPQTESTGNPMRDLELQRMATARRFDREDYPQSTDEYAGLMSQRERQWIINIQLSQLKCENPFLDDYYFTVFNLRKQHQQFISAGNDDSLDETSKTRHDDTSENHGGHEGGGGVRQPKREEEGAQLLIQPDSPRNPYTPLQFSNSLGKLQAATVKAPRKIIDVGILNTDTSENVSQKDSRNFKLTLLELERLYNLLIEVEDCEKKLLALPTNTSMRVQVEDERDEAVKKFGTNLTGGNRLKRYLTVRKGKTLMKRGLRLLDDLQMGLVCTNLIQHFTSILRKDREEQLLSDFWDNGLRRHFLGAPFELVHHYLTLLTAQTYSVKSFVAAPLGSSILIAVVHQAAVLLQDQNENGEAIQKVLMALGGKLNDANELGRPLKPFNMQLPNCGLSESCMQQLGRLQKI